MKIILLLLISVPLWAQSFLPVDGRFVPNAYSTLSSFETLFEVTGNSQSGGRKSMLLSLVLPGAGQLYNLAPIWKPALFLSVEILGIASAIKWKQSGDNVRRKFESFADEHWGLELWYLQTKNIWPDRWKEILEGTHKLTLIINGNYKSSDELVSLVKDYNLQDIRVVRDRDFYENIGKYDQFVGGWDDKYDDPFDTEGNWYTIKKGTTNETIILTSQKDYYRGLRHDSNRYKSQVRYAVTGLMYNHVLSALEAFLDAKNRTGRSGRISYQLNLFPDPLFSRGVGGVRITFQW